jgi:hypothetical protein
MLANSHELEITTSKVEVEGVLVVLSLLLRLLDNVPKFIIVINQEGGREARWVHGQELVASGYVEYVWKRLLTISVEDCHRIITQEISRLCMRASHSRTRARRC